MFNRRLIPFHSIRNFFGVNTKDSSPNMLDGEWHEDSINIFSNPKGAVGSRPGYSALTAATLGTPAWCGFYEFQRHVSGTTSKFYVGGGSDGQVYNYTGGQYTIIGKGFSKDDENKRYNFFTLNNTLMVMPGGGECPCLWAGTGSLVSHTTAVEVDWGVEWQRYGWLHSTVDPRLMYYCDSVGNADDAYTSFLNFDDDGEPLTGCGKQGDDLICGKEHALHRVQYRGTEPLFKKYRLLSNIGPINFESIKTLPDGSMVFLAPDCNFYRLSSDTPIPVGDNIQNYIKDGVLSRLKYAVAGINYKRNQYWCSFTYTSGATTNDRTVVMDYSRPYQDSWGLTQYPWFIYDISANCFAEVTVSGEDLLYHGNYAGKMFKDDTGTIDDATAFRSYYRSKNYDFGDLTLDKKFPNITFSYQNKGDWDLSMTFVADENVATQKTILHNMQEGVTGVPLWDRITWDNFNWSSETDSDKVRDINLMGKTLYCSFGTDGANEAWNMYWYTLHMRSLGRGSVKRER